VFAKYESAGPAQFGYGNTGERKAGLTPRMYLYIKTRVAAKVAPGFLSPGRKIDRSADLLTRASPSLAVRIKQIGATPIAL